MSPIFSLKRVLISLSKHFLLTALVFTQFTSLAFSQTLPITPDGSTNTQVTQTASGIDQVNIAAPNAGGLSHNKFSDYNVNQAGQVINNFSGNANATTQTQIGGLVTANPNLTDSGSARVILNEVTSNNVSQLRGYTEIAGARADLIIANPNGISCLGCGFINTSRLLMVAGSSDFDASGNLGFNLKEQQNPNLYVPLITIDGLGLDASRTTSTEIIASSIKLISTIYGADDVSVSLKTGEWRARQASGTGDWQIELNDQFEQDSGTSEFQELANQPVFAIDASSLAKIQSGKIYLIATKQGVGVNMAGEILASQNVNIDASGDVYYSKISAGDSANLKSSAKLQSIDSNSTISAPILTIQAQEFKNLGLVSAYDLNIQNSGALINLGNIEALNLNLSNIGNNSTGLSAGINNSGSIYGEDSLSISGNNLTNSGSIFSKASYAITLTALLSNSGLISSGNNLNITANQLANTSTGLSASASEISAQNNLTFFITTSATNSGNLIATKNLNFTADSLNNSNQIKSGETLTFNLNSLNNNQSSSIYSDTILTLNLASNLTNYGSISSQSDLTVTGSSGITNSNQILSNGIINISGSSFVNSGDSIVASLTKSLTLALTGSLQNDGDLRSKTDLTLSANSFNNSGNVLAGIAVQTKKENSDEIITSIISFGNLSITSTNNFTNSGNLQSTSNSQLISGSFANSGNILSYANLGLTSSGLNNSGKITAQNNLAIANSNSSLINSGSFYGKNDLTISNSKDSQNSGIIYSDGTLTISSINFDNLAAASIFSNGNANLTIDGAFTNSGDLQSNNFLNISSFPFIPYISLSNPQWPIEASFNNSGNIVSKFITISSFGDLTNSGTIGSYKDLTIFSKNLNNSSEIKSLTNSTINLTGNLTNSENALIYSASTLSLSASGSLSNSGEISTASAADLTFSNITNSNKILANNTLTITSDSINNNDSNSVLASVNEALNFKITDYLTNAGTIFAKTNLTLGNKTELNSITNSGSITFNKIADTNSELKVKDFNNSGSFTSNSISDDLTITSSNSFANSGNLSSGKNFTINLSASFNNSGNLSAANNLNLNSTSSSNNLSNSGQIGATNNLTITSNSDVNNSGNVLANNAVNISAININNGSVVNTNAVISSLSNGATLTTSGDVNNYGEVSSKNALSLSATNLFNYSNIIAKTTLSVTNSGLINNAGNFQSSADTNLTSNSLNNSGTIYSKGNATITNSADLTNSGNIYAEENVTTTSNNLINQNSGVLSAKQNLTATANNNVTNSGSIAATNDLTVTAKDIANSNLIQSGNDLNIAVTGNLANNSGSKIYAGNNLDVTATGTSSAINNSGSISVINYATFASKTFVNSNSILANNSLTLNSNSITNNQNSTLASINQDLSLNITDYLTNAGTIFAKTNLVLGSGAELNSITNSGSITFNKLINTNSELKVKDFNNSGSFYSGSSTDSLTITSSNSFVNSGTASAQGNFTINSKILTSNSGTLNSGSSFNLNSTNLNNSGQISSLGSLKITDSATIANSKQILSSGALTINAQNLTNSADSITNLAIASLASSLTLNISNQLTNSGQLSSVSDLNINANNFTNNSNANVLAGAKLTQTINQSINNSGNFQSVGNTILTSSSLTNSGSIKSFGTSTINIAEVINQVNAVIFSSSDSTITSSTSLTNSGSILSNANLGINSATTTNNNQIYAASNLTLNLSNTLTNNSSASLTSLGNLTINSSSSIANSNQIASNSNLSITANSLTNLNTIQSNGNLTLNLSNLTNSKNILSAGTFTITTSAATSNSGTLQSGSTFTINANSLTNSSSALILANNNISITASSITNQNTKPSSSTASSGIISTAGDVILRTDYFNNTSGLVMGKIADVKYFNGSSMDTSALGGSFIFSQAILLDLGNTDYNNKANLSASTIKVTANNITNTGKVTATDYIILNATGNSGESGSGNITNGSATGDNSNIQLAAGTYINFTAKNNIENYATIQGSTNTTLTATNGSVNNYSTGKITGGSGTTTVNATNGSFNNSSQTSVFTSNNNAIFNVKDLNNTGEISVANDLTTNVTNNLNNNPTALIWSGHDATFNVANIFLNNQADIYADRNLTIQKNSTGDKTNSFSNVSGNIETYAGNITIKATALENKRSVDPSYWVYKPDRFDSQGNFLRSYTYYWNDGQYDLKFVNESLYNWTQIRDRRFGSYNGAHQIQYIASAPINKNSIAASIISGGKMTLTASSILNDVSNILSTSDLTITADSLTNQSKLYPEMIAMITNNRNFEYSDNAADFNNSFSAIPLNNDYYVTALIKSGGSFYGSGFTKLSNITISPNYTTGNATKFNSTSSSSSYVVSNTTISGADLMNKSTTINGINSYNLGQTGAISVDLSAITAAISNNSSSASGSSYNVNNSSSNTTSQTQVSSQSITKGSSTSLSSTSSQVSSSGSSDSVDSVASQVITKKDVTAQTAATTTSDATTISASAASASTSNMIFSGSFRINLDPAATTPLVESRSQFTDLSKFFGSAYFFNQMGLNGAAVLSDIDRQVRTTNNNVSGATRMLGDSFVETKLILDQIKTLTNDSLFLSKTNTDPNQQIKELLDNSVAEFARLGLNAQDVAINGLSASQVGALTKDVITFETTVVNGINVLAPKIYLSQDTRNRLFNSNSLTGGSALASSSTLFGQSGLTIDSPSASLINNGSIVSGGNLALNIGSLTNKTNSLSQAQIIAANNLSITASTGDINNIGANIGSLGALNITALNGSILNTAIVQTNDKNLLAQNSESYQLKSGDSARSSGNITSTLLQNASIKGGSISINAANDFTNLAASISTAKNTLADGSTTSGNLSITAGDDINIATLELRNRTETRWGSGKKGGMSISDTTSNLSSNIDSSGSLTLFASGTTASVSSFASEIGNINITGSKLTSADNLTLTAKNDITIASAQDTTYSFAAGRTGKGKSYLNTSNSTTQVASDLSTTNNGNITITSGYNNTDTVGSDNAKGNLNIIASKLTTSDTDNNTGNNSGSGNISLTARNNLIISSDLNTTYSKSLSSTKSFSSKTTNLKIDSSSTNVASEISGNDITTTSGNNTYIIASSLSGSGDGQITAGKYTDSSSNLVYNSDATLNIVSATDEKFHYVMNQKISTDYTAVAVGMISAIAVTAATGGAGAVAMAGASGAMVGAGAKKSKTTIDMTYDAVQKSSELSFGGSLKTESGSDTNIISSNLSANQIDINAGKITDANGDLQTINSNANLNITTIADIHIKESSVKKTHANYLAVAATSAAVAGMSMAVGAAGQAGGNYIGTAIGGEVMGQYLGNVMFYAGMAGTSLSMVDGAAAASTDFSNSSTSTKTETQVASNLSSVGDINLLSAKNLNVSASNIQTTGIGDINLTSEVGDVSVMAGINSSTTTTSGEKRDLSSVGFSHTHSSVGIDFTQTGNENTTTVTQTSMASSILDSANDIKINSGLLLSNSSQGGSTNILASTLSANNQINITANNEINIKSVEEVAKIVSDNSDVTNTITLSVGNAWLGLADSAVQSAERISDSSGSQTDDKAKAANTTAASAQIGMNVLQAIVTAPSFGFYGAVTDTLSKTTSTSESNYVTNAASNLYATNDINLTSNSDLTIKGSNVYSENGDINLRSKEGNVNITGAQNSVSSSSSSRTDSISETVSVSGGGIFASIPTISTSSSSSDLNSTSYLSSTITASNGSLNINAKEDTNVIGSSVLAKDVAITTNNLNVESLQSKLKSNSESNSYSFGGNIGFNNSDSSQDRLWTDNVASIIGTNSVTINTENNTNIIGGVIANSTNGIVGNNANDGNNLTINTKTMTYSNLYEHNNSETNTIGINVGLPVGFGGSSPNNLSIVADPKNTTLGLSYAANSSNQSGETKATIGNGTINLNSNITRDSTTGEVINITGQETLAENDSRIANLNRDIATNQIDNGTHYEGGYNIDLNISVAVLSRAYELHKDGLLADEAKKNLTGTGEKLYKLTPMGTSLTLEDLRGSKQSWAWGDTAVYKDGTEPNGVRDSNANNVGQQNIPIDKKTGGIDYSLVGTPVKFGSGIPGFVKFATSSKEGGLTSVTCNYGLPGCNDMSVTHDPLANYLKKEYPNVPTIITNQGTILPAYIVNTYGLIGKPVNMLIDYIQTPASTTNLNTITNLISVPTINLQSSQ